MARRKRESMSEGKKNIIAALLQEYDIQSAEDIHDTLKDLLGGTIQGMLKAEIDKHLRYEPYNMTYNTNARNVKNQKSIKSKYGETVINVPKNCENSFEPKIVRKR